MDQNERRIIDDLFARLDEAERRGGPRDAEAEGLIARHLGRQPAAPYYMAQVIVVQQDALANAQARIEQLERAASERPAGGFLGGAAQTVMGVAGGVLIADALGDLFAADPAAAAEPGVQEETAPSDEPGAEEGFSDAGDIGFDEF